ncbi:hypothetical protein CIB84_013431 [Bambusicola thoracicus]|uniref:Uncharacterized protein n=1 Tax=Bambusicola thoracicus TaxID=9083 RepID=A0A2P4SFE3_BAMTH|nr:hypothetical protein CIB84_013431 [Bambusicola thoracicus]
MKTGKQSC